MPNTKTTFCAHLIVLAALLLASTGCTAADTTPNSTVPTTSADSTVTLGLPADAPQSYEAAERSANALMLMVEEIPGGDWQKGGPVTKDDFPNVICGVNNEPQRPAGAFVSRKTHPSGAIMFQVIRPVGATQAAKTVADMSQAFETCTSDKRILDGQTVTYDMARVRITDPAVLVYRQNRSDIDQGVWSFVAYMTARDSLVVFVAFSSSPDTPTEFLDGLVAAVRKKG